MHNCLFESSRSLCLNEFFMRVQTPSSQGIRQNHLLCKRGCSHDMNTPPASMAFGVSAVDIDPSTLAYVATSPRLPKLYIAFQDIRANCLYYTRFYSKP